MTVPGALTVLAWDHPRAIRPLEAAAATWPGGIGIVVRSLAAFGDDIPGAGAADLVLIDHPHIGAAAGAGEILALDGLLEARTLERLRRDAIGGSGDAYVHEGASWAIAVDAACHAMATQPGVEPPATLVELLAALADLRVALPLHPAHAVSAHITIAASLGAAAVADAFTDAALATEALHVLAEVARRCPPEAYAWEPPQALAAIEAGTVDLVPFTYGYVGYAVEWHDVPRASHATSSRPVLGGVGMAVLASCAQPAAAAAFAAWFGSAAVQRDVVLPAGGQPAGAEAWSLGRDPLFGATAEGMANAVVRPRDAWWPDFQNEAGRIIADGLRRGADAADIATGLARRFASTGAEVAACG